MLISSGSRLVGNGPRQAATAAGAAGAGAPKGPGRSPWDLMCPSPACLYTATLVGELAEAGAGGPAGSDASEGGSTGGSRGAAEAGASSGPACGDATGGAALHEHEAGAVSGSSSSGISGGGGSARLKGRDRAGGRKGGGGKGKHGSGPAASASAAEEGEGEDKEDDELLQELLSAEPRPHGPLQVRPGAAELAPTPCLEASPLLLTRSVGGLRGWGGALGCWVPAWLSLGLHPLPAGRTLSHVHPLP